MPAPLALAQILPHLLPEACLAAGVGAVLLSELCLPPRERNAMGWIAAAFGLMALALALSAPPPPPSGTVTPMIFVDRMGIYLKALFASASVAVILLTIRSREAPLMPAGETHAFLLAAALGCCLLGTARHFLMLYLGMEIVSYGSYLLAGFLRHDLRSNEAALKYVLYGAVASGMMLFGISILYGMTGTLDLAALPGALARAPSPAALAVPFALILTGLGFKISAAPFHQWTPDVYEGAPTPVAAFLSVAPKAAGLAALARVTWTALSSAPEGGYGSTVGVGAAGTGLGVALSWPIVIGVLSALTMTWGNLSALFQTNAKRLLAYSSIAHAGYMLMGLAAAAASGDGLKAVLFYLSVYLAMNLGAFGVVMALSQVTGSEELARWRGQGWRHPFLGACMVVFLMSLTGLPPFGGFVGKVFLFKAALGAAGGAVLLPGGASAGLGWWMHTLVVIGLVNSVISLFYYLSIAKALFMERAPDGASGQAAREGSAGWLQPLTVGFLAAATLALGVWWGPVDTAVDLAVRGLGAAP